MPFPIWLNLFNVTPSFALQNLNGLQIPDGLGNSDFGLPNQERLPNLDVLILNLDLGLPNIDFETEILTWKDKSLGYAEWPFT